MQHAPDCHGVRPPRRGWTCRRTVNRGAPALPRVGPALLPRQEQRPLAGLLQVTTLLTTGQADLVAAVERGLAENPMLARRPG
jgi:hypothetical protein